MSELRLKGEWASTGRADRVRKPCGQLESTGWAEGLRNVWCPGSETEGEDEQARPCSALSLRAPGRLKVFPHRVAWLHLPLGRS